MGLSDSPLCRRCGAEDETSAHILCESEALASLRHVYLGSFLELEDVKNINLGAKKIFTQELEGTRRRGRPRKRWKEEVERDLQVLGVRRSRELVTGKNGGMLFDRPKPTAGCSTNGEEEKEEIWGPSATLAEQQGSYELTWGTKGPSFKA
jgi:hypothetical protein